MKPPRVMLTAALGTHGCLFGLQGGTEQRHGLDAERAAVLEKPQEKARGRKGGGEGEQACSEGLPF